MLTKVLFPERIVDRHVGGNTTYTRELAVGLATRGVEIGRIPAGRNAITTAMRETISGRQRRPDGQLLHFSADTGPLMGTRAPSVVTVHGVASRWISTARTRAQEAVWRARVGRAIAGTDAVVTVSQSSADDIASVFNLDPMRIRVIPHGIDLEHFQAQRGLEKRLEPVAKQPYALYLGNLEPRKNLIALIEAFQDPAIRETGVRLVIAGRPAWNFDEILSSIKRYDITYLGFVSDDERVALMQNAQVFVFPSLYEGFGFPVLEAMAAGVPVVTSARGSLAEVAGPATTIDDVTSEAIADGVRRSLAASSLREETRKAGFDWVKKFSWTQSIDQHLELYRSLVG